MVVDYILIVRLFNRSQDRASVTEWNRVHTSQISYFVFFLFFVLFVIEKMILRALNRNHLSLHRQAQ